MGQNSTPLRTALSHKRIPTGVKLDELARILGKRRSSTADSIAPVWLILVNRELMIAQHMLALIRP